MSHKKDECPGCNCKPQLQDTLIGSVVCGQLVPIAAPLGAVSTDQALTIAKCLRKAWQEGFDAGAHRALGIQRAFMATIGNTTIPVGTTPEQVEQARRQFEALAREKIAKVVGLSPEPVTAALVDMENVLQTSLPDWAERKLMLMGPYERASFIASMVSRAIITPQRGHELSMHITNKIQNINQPPALALVKDKETDENLN